MRRKRATPGLEKAIRYIEQLLAGSTDPRLPSCASIAQRCGLSHVTVWKAMRVLQGREILFLKPGKGALIRSRSAHTPRATQPASEPTPFYHQTVSVLLERDIARAWYAPGILLPSYKELSLRYRASYPVLRKAVASLAQKRILEPSGRGYRVPRFTSEKPSGRITFFTLGDSSGKPVFWSPNQAEDYRWLEQECSHRRLGLDLLTYDFTSDSIRFHDGTPACRLSEFRDRPHSVGYILWLQNLYDHQVARILPQFLPLSKPVAVDCRESVLGVLSHSMRTRRNFRFFEPLSYSSRAGVHMARYMIEMGHHEIACIFPHGKNEWSAKRMEGILGEYHRAGLPEPLSMHSLIETNDLVAYYAMIHRKIERFSSHSLASTDHVKIETARAIAGLTQQISTAVIGAVILERILPFFDSILENRNISALIVENDSMTVQCLRHLSKRRINVPRDLSVVSFDDSLDASVHDITSYNFNVRSEMAMMISFILNPRTLSRSSIQKSALLIDGFVTERRSSRRLVPSASSRI